MNRDDDRQLWDLLGKAAAPQPSPFFGRNVLREIRQQQLSRSSILSWLSLRWLAPAAGLAAVIIAGALAVHQPHAPISATTSFVAKADVDDDVAADLDDLVGSDDEADDTSTIR
jgi:hypothetical protein